MNCAEAEAHFNAQQRVRYQRLLQLISEYREYGVGYPLGGFQDFEYEALLYTALHNLCGEVD